MRSDSYIYNPSANCEKKLEGVTCPRSYCQKINIMPGPFYWMRSSKALQLPWQVLISPVPHEHSDISSETH